MYFEEFYEICMQKSFRPKNKYIKNKNVEEISKNCLNEKDESNKIKILCSLDGVGIPTASAILSVIYPEKYPIIDKRCVEQLIYFGYNINENFSVKNWIKYLNIMREIAKIIISLLENQIQLFLQYTKNH